MRLPMLLPSWWTGNDYSASGQQILKTSGIACKWGLVQLLHVGV